MIKLNQYTNRIKGSDSKTDLIHFLHDKEKQLAKSMDIVKVLGKYDRTVPVILTKNFVQYIHLLNSTRQEANIPTENKYVFPYGTDRSIYAGRATKQVVEFLKTKCEFSRPELITAKQFRRILGSYLQYLNLQDRDLENVCSHMVRDLKTHLSHYRLHSDAAELGKVGKILLLMEWGPIEKYSGKELADIDFSVDGKFWLSLSSAAIDCIILSSQINQLQLASLLIVIPSYS